MNQIQIDQKKILYDVSNEKAWRRHYSITLVFNKITKMFKPSFPEGSPKVYIKDYL